MSQPTILPEGLWFWKANIFDSKATDVKDFAKRWECCLISLWGKVLVLDETRIDLLLIVGEFKLNLENAWEGEGSEDRIDADTSVIVCELFGGVRHMFSSGLFDEDTELTPLLMNGKINCLRRMLFIIESFFSFLLIVGGGNSFVDWTA